MKGVNPKITEKIHSMLGKDTPPELIDFFDKMLEHQVKHETANFSTEEMTSYYNSHIVKTAKINSVIKFLEDKK